MHPEDHPLGPAEARALIAAQMPDLAAEPLRPLPGGGTDNVLFRLGRTLLVRFPRRAGADAEIDRLAEWLPRLAPHLPLEVPVVRRRGGPGSGYPFHWSIGPWLPGRDAYAAPPGDPTDAALALAGFLQTLAVQPGSAGAPQRGAADRIDLILGGLEPFIARFAGEGDPAGLRRQVDRARAVPGFAGPQVWVHGDLHPLNLLTRRGRLAAVIDWGGMGLGDPAMDLMPAWTLFDAPARLVFRRALDPDPAAWARGRALALAKAIMAIPYYRLSNPVFCASMRQTLARVLAD